MSDRNLTGKMFASAEDPGTEKGNLRARTPEFDYTSQPKGITGQQQMS